MDHLALKHKASALKQLHHGPRVLLLPNVWDVASALLVQKAGFPALATTSAGIAFLLGYPDGQKITRREMLDWVEKIARRANVPVSADVEAGYGSRPEDAAETARGVLDAGAVGLNLEDATGEVEHPLTDLQLQLEKIRAVREVAAAAGVPLVLNARTDVYLREVGPPEKRYDHALMRLAAFRDAGADCLFAPGVKDLETIGRLVGDLQFPLNILAGPGLPPVPQLQQLGVARISLGSGVMRATLGALQRITTELAGPGAYAAMENAPSFAEMNKLLE
jgi:2-methylisocitrate lyase-like PEP mutase family enzyme